MRPFTLAALAAACSLPAQATSFVNYESPQVHPIAMSVDQSRLFVVNTPDQRLAIYSLARPRQPVLLREIPVGLEPVTVRPRTADEVWVVNYLSDSISVVSLATGQVTATIQVKDEPTDVVFAAGKAFVSAAGSDQVVVFDPITRRELRRIDIFGDEPRSLLVNRDGSKLWVVVHRSGNETTILGEKLAPTPPKPTNPNLPPAPSSGLIIDSEDRQYASLHDVVLPDYDLVEIDTAAERVVRSYPAVGTINFTAALRPGTDEVWIANTEARNRIRFVTLLRGHAVDNRVTRVDTGAAGTATPFDLNLGIDYNLLPNPKALASALAQPTDVLWNAAGTLMYVAAFGTDRIGIVDQTGKVKGLIEVGDTPGQAVDPRRKRGPRGLALHHRAQILYVLNRLSNSITAIDTAARQRLWELRLPDPTPASIKAGRGFLYDAKLSGNGTFACAACHIDGDIDGLAWDLGDPGGEMFVVKNLGMQIQLHPMKGPMTTQTLKGLTGTAPFHWRGDQPRLDDFNGAFDSLMGKTKLATADMDTFVEFMQSIRYPPNPHQRLDRTLPTPLARAGENRFLNQPFVGKLTCVACHSLPTGTNGIVFTGKILQEPQGVKTAQLRNIYKRDAFVKTAQGRKGGFGLTHDGVKQNVFDFLGLPVFRGLSTNSRARVELHTFLQSFDTGTAPTVGYQATVDANNLSAMRNDVLLLAARARAGDIDLVIKGVLDGRPRGMLYEPKTGLFSMDTKSLSAMSLLQLDAATKAGRTTLTVMGVPPGSGRRIGIDRDEDSVLDDDEGVTLYGAGTKGCAGVPLLYASSEPRIGNVWFSYVGRSAPAKAFGILGIGKAAGSIQTLGITLLVDLNQPTLFYSFFADQHGELALPLPVPNDPSLLGSTFFNQIVWADRCGPQGISATQGLKVTITK